MFFTNNFANVVRGKILVWLHFMTYGMKRSDFVPIVVLLRFSISLSVTLSLELYCKQLSEFCGETNTGVKYQVSGKPNVDEWRLGLVGRRGKRIGEGRSCYLLTVWNSCYNFETLISLLSYFDSVFTLNLCI